MESDNELFNSLTQKIPEVRPDLQIIQVRDQNRDLIVFYDAMGYVPQNFALDATVQPLLSLFNGALSLEEISRQINGDLGKEEMLAFIQLLDEYAVLNSARYQKKRDKIESKFEASDVRQPALAGISYPENSDELNSFLGMSNGSSENQSEKKKIKALYAPHLDIKAAKNQYVEAFSKISHLKPAKVIFIATSHYAGYHGRFYDDFPFIGSGKDFQVAGRTFRTNQEILNSLSEESSESGFTLKDRAHRVEHSIEIQLLYASQIWQHDFEIVPILTGYFDELFYHTSGDLATKIDRFTSTLKNLIDDDTFILISGDLSHVGRKFGDQKSASQFREDVEKYDQQFLKHAQNANPENLLKLVSEKYDATRICGFPPLYTYLNMFPDSVGKLINYYWWDEKETESAVSIASILY